MAGTFRVDTARDALGEAVRAAGRQTEAAARGLRAGVRSGDGAVLARAVHEARKSLRRARALAELLRPWLGREPAGDLTALLRDARRRLAGARDATIVLDALEDALKERSDAVGSPPDDVLAGLRRRLQAERDAEFGRLDAASVPPVLALLREAREVTRAAARAADGAASDPDAAAAVLGRGLARLHRRARRAALEALAAPDAERLHRARRRWKEVGYAVAWWSPAWPRPLAAWLRELDGVVDLLGRDHDQAVLRARLSRDDAIEPGPAAELRALSERRGARLRERALPRLTALAAEPTGAFGERHVAYLAVACAAGRARVADRSGVAP